MGYPRFYRVSVVTLTPPPKTLAVSDRTLVQKRAAPASAEPSTDQKESAEAWRGKRPAGARRRCRRSDGGAKALSRVRVRFGRNAKNFAGKCVNADRRGPLLPAVCVNRFGGPVRCGSKGSPRGTLFVTILSLLKSTTPYNKVTCRFSVPLGGFRVGTVTNTKKGNNRGTRRCADRMPRPMIPRAPPRWFASIDWPGCSKITSDGGSLVIGIQFWTTIGIEFRTTIAQSLPLAANLTPPAARRKDAYGG
jgi:hypothetical protein